MADQDRRIRVGGSGSEDQDGRIRIGGSGSDDSDQRISIRGWKDKIMYLL